MKKTKQWKPSQREINLYDKLVKEANKVRKTLLKQREQDTTPVGRLPALVVPKKYKTSNRINWRRLKREMSRREWQQKLRNFKQMFGEGIKSYLRETYKKGYQLLWQEHIGELPQGKFGRYSQEQIELAEGKIGQFMEMYNKLSQMSPIMFYHMAQKGYLIDFQFIYDDLGGKEFGFIEQQMDNISQYYKVFGKSGYKDDASIADLARVYNQRTFTRVANKEAELLLKGGK